MRMTSTKRASSEQLLRSSRFALILGFGGLLVIMALAGIDAMRVLRQIRRDDDGIRRQFLFRNHVLNDIRSQLYLSGTYLRDYLLDPDPARAETYRGELEEVRKGMQSSLSTYEHQLEAAEIAPYTALQKELAAYWDVVGPIVNWGAEERRRRGYEFLRDDVFPRRAAMLEIAGRIGDINEQQLNAGNDRVVALLVAFQNRLAVTLFATLALGLGMAAFSMGRILRLEAHAEARFEEVAQARQQLTNLSARLVEAQETERKSLSRELHDEVGQSLSAVLVELRNLAALPAIRSDPRAHSHVETIKSLVESTVSAARNMALLLRPSMLDDLGLIPALKWHAREVSKRTSMDVSVAADLLSDDLPDEYKTCVYRVVQEALHNCARHSRATTVRVRVQQKANLLLLCIQDDGEGFDMKQSKGLGLLGIEERVAPLGGSFEIRSQPGVGTTLTIELPLRGGAEERGGETGTTDSYLVGR